MLSRIISEYKKLIPCNWEPENSQLALGQKLIEFSNANRYQISTSFVASYIEAVNQKLDLNTEAYQNILDAAFSSGVKLNYILKNKIKKLLDSTDVHQYELFLEENGVQNNFIKEAFKPVTIAQTQEALKLVTETDKKSKEVLTSIFSRYLFNLFEPECTGIFFANDSNYFANYFDFLNAKYPDLFNRECALVYIEISEKLFRNGYDMGCNIVLHTIKEAFDTLQNHCDLAVFIPDIKLDDSSIQWKLYGDIVLFAEKCRKEKIDRTYFRWKKVSKITTSYISGIDNNDAEWEYAFQGFVYKDCFVTNGPEETQSYNLLLIFEKNVRDERLINCPACRSIDLQGNSYPILNVRSWECQNPLCPDRSKYNRGKRYSFMSLTRQRQMLDEENRIDESSVAKWHLDCVSGVTSDDIFEMCLRHYSCVNDGVSVYTAEPNTRLRLTYLERKINLKPFCTISDNLLEDFKNCAYFKRYIHVKEALPEQLPSIRIGKANIINGNSFLALMSLNDNSIDGVVTSPPYYNAKEYSQWENIYCYLYDMYNISKELYRIMKPGAVYLFNIFDYFDNENNIVLSAMGNKRMILGAYMLDIFSRVGFNIVGNIIWNKGEIQGNRSFNQGNMTPYYQAPLNCWEHIFILSKEKPAPKYQSLVSEIYSMRPVIKMVRGKNILGHTAPFPNHIPELLIKYMDQGDTVIDPFLGSGTTCIVANHYNINSVGIEINPSYFDLCKKRISQSEYQQLSFN